MTTPSEFQWSSATPDEKAAKIRPLVERGESAAAIAAALGTTRSAVTGARKRARDKGEAWAVTKVVVSGGGRPAGASSRPRTEPAVCQKRPPKPIPDPVDPVLKADPFAPIAGVDPVAILDMPRFGRCRWPVDGAKGKGLLQCGDHVAPSDTYCRRHAALSRGRVNPPAKKDKSNAR